MFLKSHKWVNHPNTVTERRREMNVRESRHTAMLFDRRYQNIDTGKFDTDKLHTLNNLSLVDLMDEGDSSNWINTYVRQAKRDRQQQDTNVYNFPKHVPKDNDFDEELRREQLAKISHEKAVKEALDREYALRRLEEHRRILEEQHIELQKKKDVYAKQVDETEARLMKERNERFERMQQANQMRYVGNVRPNVWKPK
jgi:hypothetical protein